MKMKWEKARADVYDILGADVIASSSDFDGGDDDTGEDNFPEKTQG